MLGDCAAGSWPTELHKDTASLASDDEDDDEHDSRTVDSEGSHDQPGMKTVLS